MATNKPYVLHLDLADFFAIPGGTVYHELSVRPQRVGGIVAGVDSVLLASFLADDAIHAVRLVIERAHAMGEERVPTLVAERAELARSAFRGYCQLYARLPVGGLLLVPGMRDDLDRISTSHELWTWEKGDVATRRLIPTPLPGAYDLGAEHA